MPDTEIPAQQVLSEDWQRSSVWALLPLLVKAVVQWIGVIIGGAYLSFSSNFQAYAPYWITGVILLVLGSALLNWRYTLFRVSTQGVELRRGVLQKEHLLLAKSRIQELQVQQPFYFRPLRLFTVSLDSAGSQQQEFYLTGVTSEQLVLLQGGVQLEQELPSTPFVRVWLATLYNKHLWLPLVAVLGAAQSQLDGKLFDHLFAQGREVLQESGLQQSFALQLAASLSVLLMVGLVLLLMTLIWLYPQRFLRDERQLQLTQGVVLKKSQRIHAKRVQMMTVNQPWLARIFGHFSLIFHGFTNAQVQRSKFILLGQTGEDINQQLKAQQLLALSEIQRLPLQRYVPAYFQRLLLIRGIIAVLLSLLCVVLWQTEVVAFSTGALVLLVAVLWLLADLWAYRRWHGFCVQDQVLYLWHGGLGQFWQVLPLQQVQKVQLLQSLFFRRQQLVQVKFSTANGTVTLAALPNQQAQDLYRLVLELRPELVSTPELIERH
ncbi:PH domain-containing protein [Rheinheimera soli]|uniref:Membrane protein YdbT with pleckstrin-like domain n=1 Tax=Rheinheimera soli TaxID=443616 RepID=A0ABU1VYQ5_9GAMM|nr:PH domain-containing protein [Rheinheimera soli]MDR7120837.1 putative membrane protein YdbT with pleckstrin-like domain [Rheinheimera soli]